MTSSPLQFCPICNKPFTLGLSYTRHVAYCRRAQNRPRVRRKSCRACKTAKAKCSFQARCLRCTTKGVECVYDRPFDNDAQASAYQTLPSGAAGASTESGGLTIPEEFDMNSNCVPDMSDINSTEELSFESIDKLPFNGVVSPLSYLNTPTLLPLSWDLPIDFPVDNLATRKRDLSIHHGYLTRIGLSDTFAQRSADLILEALYAIPEQMTRRETFPPFIHPHWNLPDLPEPLAVCMHLAQMYTLQAAQIRGFIWRTILAEQRRAVEKLDVLTDQDLLAETQAGMVYLIMRLVDGVMHDLDWTKEMMTIQNILCTRFLENNDNRFCMPEESNPSLTWEDWIYAESRRRTSLVWFLITRTIVVKSKNDCPTTDTPEVLPLPAPKTQWEARTRDSWIQELGVGTPAISTFGCLVRAKKVVNDRANAQMLGAWNARTDNLGSLLNVAVGIV